MRLMRINPVLTGSNRAAMHEDFDRFFDGFFTRSPLAGDVAPLFAPPTDIHETAEAFELKLDLPGVSLKDVKVSLSGDTLTIRGERNLEKSENDKHTHRTERIHGSFERSFKLAPPLRADLVKATYRDGVLEVTVPKAEAAKVREIEVQAG
jgi:HSP20 family protein